MFGKKILKKERITHNTLTLSVENEGLIIDKQACFFLRIFDNNNTRSKPYTPVKFDKNELVFIIKHYNVGGVADYICSKEVGDTLFISEPIYKISLNNDFGKNILMLAGGTGITPMMQFINSSKDLNFVIVFSSSTTKDIILNEEILNDKNNIKIYHIISKKVDEIECREIKINTPSDKSNFKKMYYGRVTKEMIEEITKENSLTKFDYVCCCGPRDYMADVCGSKAEDKSQGEISGIIKDLGYSKEEVYKF